MDVLSDVLDTVGLRGTLYFRTCSTPPWGVRVPQLKQAARFHLVARGRCLVRFDSGEQVQLEPGDMILIPRGAPHVLADQTDSPVLTLQDVLEQTGYDGNGVLVYGGPGDPQAKTELICGHLSFGEGADHPLLRALPPYLRISADLRLRHPWLDETMRLMARVMFSEVPGAQASVIRLSEVLFVESIRACAQDDPGLGQVLDAMLDPRIGKALTLIHRHPERDWTVASLGSAVALSRSRFAAQFQERMDCSPMAYLTDWRLQKARAQLVQSRSSVQQVAAQVGYKSAAAFTRAFSQHFGRSPMAVRKEAEEAA